ncbi:MAG: histidine phosphatase family protein [Anaerolineales bacterium]|nr:histidine phosphatase family protein [Anaerolineales bacterium]
MKRLYLVRHSKSSWKNPGLTDFDRPLNKRGKRDAPFMGALLMERGVFPDIILSSPAKRALRSAKIIAEEIEYPLEEIVTLPELYMASAHELLDLIRYLDDVYAEVMLFGHNPGFTDLANFLTEYDVDNIPTSGVFCVDFDVLSWGEVSEGSGKVAFFDYPKKFR